VALSPITSPWRCLAISAAVKGIFYVETESKVGGREQNQPVFRLSTLVSRLFDEFEQSPIDLKIEAHYKGGGR
jgi:hypothetical protein